LQSGKRKKGEYLRLTNHMDSRTEIPKRTMTSGERGLNVETVEQGERVKNKNATEEGKHS